MAMEGPRILMLGAGAVGMTYGYHLEQGGASVTYFVKPKYRESVLKPTHLYPLNDGALGTCRAAEYAPSRAISSLEELTVSDYDQVWLSISSTALRSESVEAFLKKLSSDGEHPPLLISLLPGIDDRKWVLERYPESKLINGMISLIAYWAPLEGEPDITPGWAFYFPPFGPSPFSGPKSGVDAVLSILKRGKQPATAHADVTGMSAFPTAVMMPLLAALELEGWKFERLAQGSWLKAALEAMSETLGVVEAVKGNARPLWSRVFSAFWVRAGLKVAPYLLPLPIETYLRVHFTKVGDQTLFFLKSWQTSAEEVGVSTEHLRSLAASLENARLAR